MWENMALRHEIMCKVRVTISFLKKKKKNGLNFTVDGEKCFLSNNGQLHQIFVFVSQFLIPLTDCKPPKSFR